MFMKASCKTRLIALFIASILLALPWNRALAEDYTAQTMRLLHYEGEVEIQDTNGKSRFVMENVRFKSGEAMITGLNSIASVGLDATKIVSLDQNTRVEFFKNGDQMRLKLTEGTILLDVKEKLDENESLDVETSNLTVGIRGTVLKVTQEEVDGIIFVKITLLEGTCKILYTDEKGKKQIIKLTAGYTAIFTYLDDNDKIDYPVEIRKTEDADTEGFVNELMEKDPELKKRILAARGQPMGSPASAPTTPPAESTEPSSEQTDP